jgi:CheY-like chemotaxis protein
VTQLRHTQILIVDDDTAILRVLQRSLADYQAVTAQEGAEALAILDHCHPDLLITDYAMPAMTGPELLARARHHHPALKGLILTAHAAWLDQEPWWTTERHLEKPCSLARLRSMVADLIGPASEAPVA